MNRYGIVRVGELLMEESEVLRNSWVIAVGFSQVGRRM
jgi:hypothetical protein